jgi:Carboxypeptidase regulatory-like domain
MTRLVRSCGVAVLIVGAAAGAAHAQATSAVGGAVTDSSGAVLPGVTVEASSPVLIERVKSAITDGKGEYKIIDLRPGVYSLTFTLTGFSSVVREGVRLEADFTASISVQMKVGALAETITVSGQSPVVDVQSTQQRSVLTRELIDTLPTGRNYQTVMQGLPAVSAQGTVRFDVGGSSVMQQGSGSAYGGRAGDFALMIDNMSVSTPIGNGDRPGLYINDGGFEQTVYVVNAGAAEVQTPGIKANLIPKQGGNRYTTELLTTFSNSDMQGFNIDDDLVKRGYTGSNLLYRAYDIDPTFGGPIKQDHLWFFVSYRRWAYNNILPKVKTADGKPFPDSNLSQAAPARLTTQLSQKHRFTIAFEKTGKEKFWNGLDSGLTSFEAAGWQAVRQHYYAQGKLTSTLTNKLLLEVGHSFTRHDLPNKYHDGTAQSAVFPYGAIYRTNLSTSQIYGAPAPPQLIKWWNYYSLASLSYVTGSHSFKVGVQDRAGSSEVIAPDTNCTCQQRYRTIGGVVQPDSVVIYANPLDSKTELKADLGIFGQDSWTMGRLTTNLGLRWDYYRGDVPAQQMPAGRFVPVRNFAAIDNLPVWKDLSPRVGLSYDLFNNSKTALKGSIGKYTDQEALSFIENYNPALNGSATGARSTDTRTWKDSNANDIAEESELGPSTNLSFGLRNLSTPDPNLKRGFQTLYNISIQHELHVGFAVSASYNRRGFHNLRWTDNTAVSLSDYSIVNIADPRTPGQQVPVYILPRALVGVITNVDKNSANNTLTYNGVDFGVNARLDNGAIVTAGTSTGRSVAVNCDIEDPNGVSTPSPGITPLIFCDQSQFHIPFLTTFKTSVSYPLRYGFRASAIFQDQPGDELRTFYSISPALLPALTVPTVNVRLDAPGVQYYDRVRTLDLSFAKSFAYGRLKVSPKIDVFNVFNANTVLTQVTTYSATGQTPTAVLNPRLARVGVNIVF